MNKIETIQFELNRIPYWRCVSTKRDASHSRHGEGVAGHVAKMHEEKLEKVIEEAK